MREGGTEHLEDFEVVSARGKIVRIRKRWRSYPDKPDSDIVYAAPNRVRPPSIVATPEGRFLIDGVLFERLHPEQ
jgi:hypothetical protein